MLHIGELNYIYCSARWNQELALQWAVLLTGLLTSMLCSLVACALPPKASRSPVSQAANS